MWFCVAVIEFVFAVLEKRVTEGECPLGGMCYNKVGICFCLLTGVKMHH
jgi:hypothetical protein